MSDAIDQLGFDPFARSFRRRPCPECIRGRLICAPLRDDLVELTCDDCDFHRFYERDAAGAPRERLIDASLPKGGGSSFKPRDVHRPPCRIKGCRSLTSEGGLCEHHRLRWIHEGRPDLDAWCDAQAKTRRPGRRKRRPREDKLPEQPSPPSPPPPPDPSPPPPPEPAAPVVAWGDDFRARCAIGGMRCRVGRLGRFYTVARLDGEVVCQLEDADVEALRRLRDELSEVDHG